MSARKVAVAPGFGGAIWLDRSQKWSRRRRAPALPPAKRPAATMTAFTAPALAPLTASNVRPSSSSRRSSTPQANAPSEPPPWTLPPIIFPGRPERWWGDEALKAETDAPQTTLEQGHQAADDVLALRRRGFFSAGALFSMASHSPVETAQ